MLHMSISKEYFDDILNKKQKILKKEVTGYWKKELLDVYIIDDKINYRIKKVAKLKISNGFGEDKPLVIIECNDLIYNTLDNSFEFKLGHIVETKNTDTSADYKDALIQELLREKQLLIDKINRDHLTNIYNRRKMHTDLDEFINRPNSEFLTAVFVDADRFKGINDFFGHDAGDTVLTYIARTLQKYSHSLNGEVYRYGGEEFIILCFMAKDRLLIQLDKLQKEIRTNRVPNKIRPISVTVSIGVSFWKKSNSKEDLIKVADNGLLKAKENGRNRIEIG